MPYSITQCYLPPDRGDIPAWGSGLCFPLNPVLGVNVILLVELPASNVVANCIVHCWLVAAAAGLSHVDVVVGCTATSPPPVDAVRHLPGGDLGVPRRILAVRRLLERSRRRPSVPAQRAHRLPPHLQGLGQLVGQVPGPLTTPWIGCRTEGPQRSLAALAHR